MTEFTGRFSIYYSW